MESAGPVRSNETEFQLIADSAPVPMWVTRLDRHRAFVNRAYVDFLNVSYQEAVDFDWRTIIHPDDVARILKQSVDGEASLKPFSLEGRYRRHDGEWRWLHSVSQPRWDASGNHIGFIGVAHDITEAKQAELAVREREAQLSAFINQTTAGFGQVDLTGRFTLVNDRFCEITGRSREELMTLTMQEITHPDDLSGNVPLFDAAVRDGTPYAIEKRYVRPDGSLVWVNNSVAVIRRADDTPYGVLAVTLDITQRKQAEAQQKLLIDELNHRVKNTLAVVQGIANQTLRDGCDVTIVRGDFVGRLMALSAAHNLLTRESWGPVAMPNIVGMAIAVHGGELGVFQVGGPDIQIAPRAAITLSLAIHELATNAVKHGALSTPGGRVSIDWSVVSASSGERLRFVWTEHGGPSVAAPDHRGFGIRMIERGLAAETGGSATVRFDPAGLQCTVDAPLAGVAA